VLHRGRTKYIWQYDIAHPMPSTLRQNRQCH
jgi:hypothetical protein